MDLIGDDKLRVMRSFFLSSFVQCDDSVFKITRPMFKIFVQPDCFPITEFITGPAVTIERRETIQTMHSSKSLRTLLQNAYQEEKSLSVDIHAKVYSLRYINNHLWLIQKDPQENGVISIFNLELRCLHRFKLLEYKVYDAAELSNQRVVICTNQGIIQISDEGTSYKHVGPIKKAYSAFAINNGRDLLAAVKGDEVGATDIFRYDTETIPGKWTFKWHTTLEYTGRVTLCSNGTLVYVCTNRQLFTLRVTNGTFNAPRPRELDTSQYNTCHHVRFSSSADHEGNLLVARTGMRARIYFPRAGMREVHLDDRQSEISYATWVENKLYAVAFYDITHHLVRYVEPRRSWFGRARSFLNI